eukprot:PhF_6_TR32990/c0_g1_i1/m.48595
MSVRRPQRHRIRFNLQDINFEGGVQKSRLLTEQGGLCKSCLEHVSAEESTICLFTGFLYCKGCHAGASRSIPAKMILHWDFTPYPTCCDSTEYLDEIWAQPLLHLVELNSSLFDKVLSLRISHDIRTQLNIVYQICKDCPAFRVALQFFSPVAYYMESDDMYSLKDLYDQHVCHVNEISEESLGNDHIKLLKQIRAACMQHVMHHCSKVCGVKATTKCMRCWSNDTLYKFDTTNVVSCSGCGATYHKHCYAKGKCQCEPTERHLQSHPDTTKSEESKSLSKIESTQQEEDVVAEVPEPDITSDIIRPILDLHERTGWRHVAESEGCVLQDLTTEFCDKKAIRATTEIACDMETAIAFLGSIRNMESYDSTLSVCKVLKSYGNGAVLLYTAHKPPVKMVSARDFNTLNAGMEISDAEIGAKKILYGSDVGRIYVLNAVNSLGKQMDRNYTRGHVYTHGYILSQYRTSVVPKIRVNHVVCIDIAGWIPGWAVDAGNALVCSRLAKIREGCESEFKLKSLVNEDSSPTMSPKEIEFHITTTSKKTGFEEDKHQAALQAAQAQEAERVRQEEAERARQAAEAEEAERVR